MTAPYLLDSNVFIEAWGKHYPPAIFPAFWDWLDGEQQKGTVGSVRAVYGELTHGEGELTDWVKQRADRGWFLPDPDEAVQREFQRVANWVEGDARWSDAAKAEFLRGADPWLIATALAHGVSVVTLERNDPNNRKKVLIPIVCLAFGVATLDTVEMMRRLGARFG